MIERSKVQKERKKNCHNYKYKQKAENFTPTIKVNTIKALDKKSYNWPARDIN